MALSACKNDTLVPCQADLRTSISPSDTTIAVGGTVTLRATLLECGGTRAVTDTLTWTSSDPDIATVDAGSGTVRGVRAGITRILVVGRKYGPMIGPVITVR